MAGAAGGGGAEGGGGAGGAGGVSEDPSLELGPSAGAGLWETEAPGGAGPGVGAIAGGALFLRCGVGRREVLSAGTGGTRVEAAGLGQGSSTGPSLELEPSSGAGLLITGAPGGGGAVEGGGLTSLPFLILCILFA